MYGILSEKGFLRPLESIFPLITVVCGRLIAYHTPIVRPHCASQALCRAQQLGCGTDRLTDSSYLLRHEKVQVIRNG